MNKETKDFMRTIEEKNPHEKEYLQAVLEVAETLIPFILNNNIYAKKNILLRMSEPERAMMFRIVWMDDKGGINVNRGYRIGMNSAIGPYKGGLRFHPSVNMSILKFLAFEQVFKNSLTTLPLGGGKGGADFDPKGKSDNEVMRFCQAFMNELHRHIGQRRDIPAGDIGVGSREIGYMFGQYKKLENEFSGVFTGKGLSWGGSFIRNEATGYGAVYFADNMLKYKGDSLSGKEIVVTGSGNVAQFVAEKAIVLGAKVLTLSDSSGFIYQKEGITAEQLEWVKDLKNNRRGRISEYTKKFPTAVYVKGEKPWSIPCQVAFPSATQNEMNLDDAKVLVKNGLICLSEGANMPLTPEAFKFLQGNNVLYAPGKASNAGGVAVSGLEMSQNSLRINWTREEVDQRLKDIMSDIHDTCVQYGKGEDGTIDYMKGANIGGFVKVADAMLAQGIV